MKRFVLFIFGMFICGIAIAQTISIDWNVGNNIYSQSTCEYGGDLNVPATAPTKYGYTFQGWVAYQPIEYLESTGTQWIDTGIIFNSGYLEMKTDLYFMQKLSAGIDTALYGTFNSRAGFAVGVYNQNTLYMYTPSQNHYQTQIYTGNKYSVYFKLNNNNVEILTLNNNTVLSSPSSIVNNYYNDNAITIFKRPDRTVQYVSPNGIGAVSIWLNGTLVRDFIPVLDSNGTPCMYDKVTGQFFYNQGTGQFIAGPVVTE